MGEGADFLSIMSGAISEPEMPDIVTFAEHSTFLGEHRRLYPRQKTLLRLWFLETEHMTAYDVDVISQWAEGFYEGELRCGLAPDVWKRVEILKDQGYRHFPEIINISGRRGGKGHLGAIMAAYQTLRLIKMDDPQWYYSIERGKELYTYVTATGLSQAKAYQFADLANAVLDAPCFRPWISSGKPTFVTLRTPADNRRIAELKARGVQLEREMASLVLMPLSANSSAARGGAATCIIFDEMAHMLLGTEGPRTADSLYNALTPSLGQLGKDGLIYVPTSPYTKVGKAYALYEDGLASAPDGGPAHPEIIVSQLPSWTIYEDFERNINGGRPFRVAPMVWDERAEDLKARNPYSFRVERESQWAEVMDAYLSPKVVDKMFEPVRTPDGLRTLEIRESGALRWIYRGHCDPSKSEANTAAAIGHLEPVVDEDGETWHHVFIDWMKVWKPGDKEDHQVDYIEVEKELAERISLFPAMKTFSYDQYGSFVTVPRLKAELKKKDSRTNVIEVPFSASANAKRCEIFKAALGLRWVHAPVDDFGVDDGCLLEHELKFLHEKNGKVDCQSIGPVTTKDLADCVMVITEDLIGKQLERFRMRDQLTQQMQVGAQGGYITSRDEPTRDDPSEARKRLAALSSASMSTGKWTGARSR